MISVRLRVLNEDSIFYSSILLRNDINKACISSFIYSSILRYIVVKDATITFLLLLLLFFCYVVVSEVVWRKVWRHC